MFFPTRAAALQFWTRAALCMLGTMLLVHVVFVGFAMPRLLLDNMIASKAELPLVTFLAMNRAWCWGVPIALVASTISAGQVLRAAPSRRLVAFAIIALVSIATTSFTIWASTSPLDRLVT